jgi:ATP-dependent helicase/nuclease subunit A
MRELTEFQKAALNTEKHIALTANAGSGKTTILCKRYIDILLETGVHVKDIAAITFTDKAASELYDAITQEIADRLTELKKAKSSAAGEMKYRTEQTIYRLENIRRDLVFSKISTIHSFCLDILKENPVEANIDANCIPVDGKTAYDLINQSIDEVISELLDDNDENIKSLIRQFSDISILSENIFEAIQKRIVSEKFEGLYSKSTEEIAAYYEEITMNLYKEFYADKIGPIIKVIKQINDLVIKNTKEPGNAVEIDSMLREINPDEISNDSILKLQNILEYVCTKDGSVRTVKYFAKKLRESNPDIIEILELYSEDIADLRKNSPPDYECNFELAALGKKFFSLFKLALERYKRKKKDSGFLDFEDILILSKDLLAKPEVQAQISDKYKFVMVDEYQDTNYIQYEIILPVVGYLEKGNLFVVGDEKQSIYGFRNADLEVFDRTKKEIGKSKISGNILTMPDNFRMVPEICLFTNIVFKKLFGSKPRILFNEVGNSDLVYGRSDNFNGKIEFIINPKSEDREESEAELVAKRILSLAKTERVLLSKTPSEPLKDEIEWKNIAILSRVRKSFDKLIPVFIKYRIPYVIIKGQGFYQQQEILDIYNYLSFLLDDSNDAALAAILRSPFFLISDVELYAIAQEQGYSFYQKMCKKAEKNTKFFNIKGILEENLSLVHSSDLVYLIRKILNDNYYLVLTAGKEDGKQAVSNIEKLINIASEYVSEGFRNTFDFVDLLTNSINNAEQESLGAVIDDTNAVNLMVVHQAKGLEYPAVFLFDSGASGRKDLSQRKKILIDKNFGFVTKVTKNQDYFSGESDSLTIDLINKVSLLKQEAELKRLLYVAVTRARNYLCISAELKKSFSNNSFIYLINKGLDGVLESLQPEIEMEGRITKTGGKNLDLSFTIPVIQDIDNTELSLPLDSTESKFKFILPKLTDMEEGEIISPTKLSIYNQCPVKYEMIYNYRLKNVLEDYQAWINKTGAHMPDVLNDGDEAVSAEDEFSIAANERGSIIHSLLQNEAGIEEVKKELDIILTEKYKDKLSGDLKNDFISKLVSLISVYKESKTFKFISSFSDFRNEFELYVKENDYFLFGIIDKIIFDRERGKIIIVDYKTDDIAFEEIKKRKENYINQLRFYSYIASKLFKDFESFEVLLVFIKHPDALKPEIITRQDLESFGITLKNTVNNIRRKNFIKNTKHCSVCNYYIKHKDCIMDIKD